MNSEIIISIISITIAIIAIGVTISAKRQTAKAAEENIRIQKRREVIEFYPIIDLSVNLKDNKIFLKINNKSDTNSASTYFVSYNFRIYAKDINIELNDKIKGNEIARNSSAIISPEIINTYLADAMPFIKRTSEKELHMHLRFSVSYQAAHPDSIPMGDEIVVHFNNNNGELALKERKA